MTVIKTKISELPLLSSIAKRAYASGIDADGNNVRIPMMDYVDQNSSLITAQFFSAPALTNPFASGIKPRRVGDLVINTTSFEGWIANSVVESADSWQIASQGKFSGTLITDTHSIIRNGFYSAVSTASNLPTNTESFYIQAMCSNSSNTSAILTAIGLTSGKMYMQRKVSGVWGSWVGGITQAELGYLTGTTSNVQAQIDSKADKDGYYDSLAAGLADNAKQLVSDKAAIVDAAEYALRTAGGGQSISDGTSALTKLYGRTDKQLLANGNFANGSTGWAKNGGTFTVANGILSFRGTARSQYVYHPIGSLIAGHKYAVFGLVKFLSALTELYVDVANFSSASNMKLAAFDKWSFCGRITTVTTSGNNNINVGYSSSVSADCDIAMVMCFDLTELGLASTITTVDQAIAHFGLQYLEGMVGSTATAKKDTAFNLFNAANKISGKKIDTDGSIVDDASSAVVFFRTVASEVATGKNNGHRLHCTNSGVVNVVGWSPFSPTDARFSKAQDIATPATNDVDYSSNPQAGYIIASLPSANVAYLIAHLKWSYTDFTTQYANEAAYSLSQLALDFGEQHGLGAYRDYIDLANRKKHQVTAFKVFNGTETWSMPTDNVFSTSGLTNRLYNTPVISNNYTYFGVNGNQTLALELNTFSAHMQEAYASYLYIKDSSYATVDAFKAHLAALYAAGTPLTVRYVLATELVTDVEFGSNAIAINDFGLEDMEYSGAVPKMESQYYDNLVDKLRMMPASNSVTLSVAHPMYSQALAIGAVYNATTGYYELNELTDLTDANIAAILAFANWQLKVMDNSGGATSATYGARTNVPPIWRGDNSLVSINWILTNRGDIETLRICGYQNSVVIIVPETNGWSGAMNLKKVIGIAKITAITIPNTMFSYLNNLKDISITGLVASITFPQSSKLSLASVVYMVQNAANTAAITITLHATAYAVMQADTTEYTYNSNTYVGVIALATAKNISILSA